MINDLQETWDELEEKESEEEDKDKDKKKIKFTGDEMYLMKKLILFLNCQLRKCSKCTGDKTLKEQKLALPCGCSLCNNCCEELASVVDKERFYICKGHNMPFLVEELARKISPTVQHKKEAGRITAMFEKSMI